MESKEWIILHQQNAQRNGMYLKGELQFIVKKDELRVLFYWEECGLCLKMQKNRKTRDVSAKWDRINSKMIEAIKMATLE